jgi:hypothetical protein
MSMKDALCFFDQYDGHWYLVDSSKREEWSSWKGLDDDHPQHNVKPQFAAMINHPSHFEVVVCENTQEGQNLDIRKRKHRIYMCYDAAEQTVRKSRGKAIKALQCQCSHPNVTYYPDASGNNDSYHACDDCDKEV